MRKDVNLRACFKIAWGPAARDFGCGQGGEAGASPQRAVTAELTQAADKRPAAGGFSYADYVCCSSVADRWRICSLVAPRHPAFSPKTGPHGILKQALTSEPSGGLDRLAKGRARRSARAGRCDEEKPVACSCRSNSPPCEHFFPMHGARGTRTTDRLVRFAHSDAPYLKYLTERRRQAIGRR